MQLLYLTEVSLFSSTIPKHIDKSVLSSYEFKNSITEETGLYICNHHIEPFLLPCCFELSNVAYLPLAALTRGQMVQKFPVQLLQQFLCLTCAVWVALGC